MLLHVWYPQTSNRVRRRTAQHETSQNEKVVKTSETFGGHRCGFSTIAKPLLGHRALRMAQMLHLAGRGARL